MTDPTPPGDEHPAADYVDEHADTIDPEDVVDADEFDDADEGDV